jgi:hypothetical protein
MDIHTVPLRSRQQPLLLSKPFGLTTRVALAVPPALALVGEEQVETEPVVLPLLMQNENQLEQKVESDQNLHEISKGKGKVSKHSLQRINKISQAFLEVWNEFEIEG